MSQNSDTEYETEYDTESDTETTCEFKCISDCECDLIKKYIKGLDNVELIIFKIAQEHLETSFDIHKSIGYMEWKSKNSY